MDKYYVHTADGKNYLGEYLTCLLGDNKYGVTFQHASGESTRYYRMVIVVYVDNGVIQQADRTDVSLKKGNP